MNKLSVKLGCFQNITSTLFVLFLPFTAVFLVFNFYCFTGVCAAVSLDNKKWPHCTPESLCIVPESHCRRLL